VSGACLKLFALWMECFCDESDFRMPFIFWSNGTSVDGVAWLLTSCISGMVGAGARLTTELRARAEGTETVRGRSFPFEAMFGVPIWRDRTRDVCASKR
jgi:hypothetical protein